MLCASLGQDPMDISPQTSIFVEGCFTWPLYLYMWSQISDSLLNSESEEAQAEGNGIVQDFSRTTSAFSVYFSCCLCKAFHYSEK